MLCGTAIPFCVAETLADLEANMMVKAMVVASSQTEQNPNASARGKKPLEEENRATDTLSRITRDRASRTAWIATDTLPASRISVMHPQIRILHNGLDGFLFTAVVDVHLGSAWNYVLQV